MAWDEWEQLKTQAAGRPSAGMQIDHLAEPTGGDGGGASSVTGGLKSTKAAWNKAGEGVGGLREGIGKALKRLEDGQTGLGSDAGCLCTGAQKDLYDSWARYVKSVDERCGSIKDVLEKVGHDLLGTDESVRSALAAIDTRYADTPAVGGPGTGR
ncbi:hypothetical protein [Streptomyces odontomachi]|uniref:hypothetical protein n=1 Tax=Streptomyces odontomachi TaxID=2944940 RepID=UPI00210D9514|nr:hypothetical protein [Streptomyces sp. ODS25]